MDDLISRQAAINKILGQPPEPHYPSWYVEQIKELPSAQPEPIKINIEDFNKEDWERLKKEWGNTPITVLSAQPKRGKWIDAVLPNDNGGLPVQVCDVCNTFFPLAYTGGGHRYCPNCGAKMEVTT